MANAEDLKNAAETAEGAGDGAKKANKLAELWAKLKQSGFGQYVGAHPVMSGALGIGTAGNLAGLFDNDKVGGQLLGAAGGGLLGQLIPKMLKKTISPQAQILSALGGGALGSLFDHIRSNEEKYNQYAANPNMRNGMVQLLPNDNTMYVTPEQWQRMQG